MAYGLFELARSLLAGPLTWHNGGHLLEKVGPWTRRARLATAGVLTVLAAVVLVAPHQIPGFVVPGSPAAPHMMKAMG